MFLPKIRGRFICTKCGCEKEELGWEIEPHGEPVSYDLCSCGGRYDLAVECEECGEMFPESALSNYDGIMVCEGCKRDIMYAEAG